VVGEVGVVDLRVRREVKEVDKSVVKMLDKQEVREMLQTKKMLKKVNKLS
jgi:hypothetical protein